MIQPEKFKKDLDMMFIKLWTMIMPKESASMELGTIIDGHLNRVKSLVEESFENVIIRTYLEPMICIVCDPVIVTGRLAARDVFILDRTSKKIYTPRDEINLNTDSVIYVSEEDGKWWEFLRMRLDVLNESITAGEKKMIEVKEKRKQRSIDLHKEIEDRMSAIMDRTNPHAFPAKLYQLGD